MLKYVIVSALFAIASAAPGFIAQPIAVKVHSAPSAVSHQSLTQVHNNAHIVAPFVKAVAPVVPVVKTYSAPIVHAAPLVPVLKTYSAPVVHHVSVVKSIASHAIPVIHAAPVVKSVVPASVTHFVHH